MTLSNEIQRGKPMIIRSFVINRFQIAEVVENKSLDALDPQNLLPEKRRKGFVEFANMQP